MKKYLLALILVAVIAAPVFAQVDIVGPETHGAFSPIAGANAQAGATASATASAGAAVFNRVDVDNINFFAPRNTNIQGQIMGQGQFGYVAPVQKVSFSSPTQLLGISNPGMAELNFGNGQQRDVTYKFPQFATAIGRLDISKDKVKKLVDYCANEKFKSFYGEALDLLDSAAAKYGKAADKLRYQIVEIENQTSNVGGLNLNGATSVLSANGLAGGGGGGVTGFQKGNTKANWLYTIVIVEIV